MPPSAELARPDTPRDLADRPARIDALEAGSRQVDTAALWTLLMVVFINLLGFGIIVPLLPFYAQSFHATSWQVALLFSAYSIGSFFGEPFWGRLSDRIGRKPLLLSTISANCLCYLALAFAPNIGVAFAVRLLGGAAAGNGSVVQGYIADVTAPQDRAGRMALLGAAYNLGFIVGPSMGGLLARPAEGPAGFRLPLLVASALAAASVCLIGVFVRESRQRRVVVGKEPGRWAMTARAVRHPMLSRLMLVTFLAGVAFTAVEATFGFWGAYRFHWTPRQIGFVFFFVGIVAVAAQSQLTGRLSRRYGEARMLAIGMAVTVCATALQPWSTGFAMTTFLMALMAAGQSVAFPNVAALISRAADADHQGQFLGLNNATGALARVAGPMAGQLMFANVSANGPFILAACVALPTILLPLTVSQGKEKLGGPCRSPQTPRHL